MHDMAPVAIDIGSQMVRRKTQAIESQVATLLERSVETRVHRG